MEIKDIDNIDLTEFFLSDFPLCYLGLSDLSLHQLKTTGKYELAPGSFALGIYNEENILVSSVIWNLFTESCINMHIYLRTKYQHTDMLDKIHEILYTWLKAHERIEKLIIMTPKPCIHVQKASEKHGFKLEGQLSNAIKWRQKTVDLLIYGYDLRD